MNARTLRDYHGASDITTIAADRLNRFAPISGMAISHSARLKKLCTVLYMGNVCK